MRAWVVRRLAGYIGKQGICFRDCGHLNEAQLFPTKKKAIKASEDNDEIYSVEIKRN